MWEAGLGIILIGIAALLIYISFQLGSKTNEDEVGKKSLAFLQPLKLLLLGVAMWLLVISASVAINLAIANSASADIIANLSTFYIIMLWTMRLVVGYFVVYYVWSLAILAIQRGKDSKEADEEDDELMEEEI